ncbi:uncharacterized protein BJX67DRAFT_113532 [Aspergillus lucknowensis]|uniref:Uncharacterized protein n=1 Tax=Aspergillus lucknowensis TaxID=176173 RepID=A0ABR4LRD1_9EURO
MKGSPICKLGPWAKLHPPLPRTPRQSEQLLNALTSSFRRELDREYPTNTPSSLQASRVTKASDGERHTEEQTLSSAHATDKHLRSILENPLFRVASPRPSASSRSFLNIETSRWAKEPMVVFDELVASGSATASAVGYCLSWQLLLASRHTGENFVKALRDSRAGSRVASWWTTSDLTRRTDFFNNHRLLSDLLKFMVAERLYDTIFVWLKMLESCNLGSQENRISEDFAQKAFNTVLCQFLKAETGCGGGVVSAMRYYLEACKTLIENGENNPKLPLKGSLLPPGAYLCDAIMHRARDDAERIPAQLYEQYTAIISTLAPATLLGATVPLYHPTHPDARPLVQFKRSIPPGRFESWPEWKRDKLMRASFQALRILIDTGNHGDCLQLARFMRDQLEGVSGAGTTKPRYHVSSEEKDLLTSLDLAFT